MLVVDDDDDVLEHEAEEQARSFLVDDDPDPDGDGDGDGSENDEHSRVLPLVLQLLEAHAAGEKLDRHMNAIRAKLRRCEGFLTEVEQKTLADDPNDERRSTELLSRRTELLSEHTERRRRMKRDRDAADS